jgi:anti-sigma regulatory factor (Ser/Thr protein kinase)
MGSTLTPHDHVVGFYERDEELVSAVTRHLSPGLAADGTVLVIATPAHRAAIQAALVAGGHRVDDLATCGRYLALDADDTLAAFMRDGRPDPQAFAKVVGALLDRVASSRPVRAFGEMVARLWDAGNVEAAIELESLWNDLAVERAFSLYCAYAMASVEASGDLAAAKHVCDRHSDVIRLNAPVGIGADSESRPADAFDRVFIPTLVVVRDVRGFVRDVLRLWGEHQLLATAEVIVAELATNAVLHACSPFRVTVSRTSSEIKIAVRDASMVLPEHLSGHPDRRGGRGISIVAALSDRWRTDPETDGKTIWATMARTD